MQNKKSILLVGSDGNIGSYLSKNLNKKFSIICFKFIRKKKHRIIIWEISKVWSTNLSCRFSS